MYCDSTKNKRNFGYNSNNMINQELQFQNMPYQGMAYQNMMYMGAEDVGEELISFNDAVELIRRSIENEREDELFYENIIEIAPTEADKELIRGIRDDERKHNNILRYLYYTFTGMIPRETRLGPEEPTLYSRNNDKNSEYMRLVAEAWQGEFAAVRKYRKILGAMPDQRSRTLINAILTDELIHANKYNYLLTKN